jgi:prepilin-type N-terminal cleavage/methylation domain-containing protein
LVPVNRKTRFAFPARRGFSLTEVLIAVGILTIALVMVGVSFPVGVMMTTNVTERTVAAVIADEAFAKIRLYGVNYNAAAWTTAHTSYADPGTSTPTSPKNTVYQVWLPFESVASSSISQDEFLYPSDTSITDRIYSWSALCRQEPDGSVRVVVFVCRRSSAVGARYPTLDPAVGVNSIPKPTLIFRDNNSDGKISSGDTLALTPSTGTVVGLTAKPPAAAPDTARQVAYLNPGCFILDDDTGEIYRVLERTEQTSGPLTNRLLTLDKTFVKGYVEQLPTSSSLKGTYKVWVVPPAVGSGKNPCIAVYQKVIKF